MCAVKKFIDKVTIECIKGDITNQNDVKAIVNAANSRLGPGGGVAGAIHEKAGPGLEQECKPYAPLKAGEAVITTGQKLPNNYIIHCLGPVCGLDHPEDELLASCYKEALKLAESYHITSIAFPSISTGNFGFPLDHAANVAFTTIKEISKDLKYIRLIRFVLFSQHALDVHKRVLEDLFKSWNKS